MIIEPHASYTKAYKKRIVGNLKLQERVKQRVSLFVINQNNPILKDRALSGSKRNLRAFSVSGNYRIIYREVSQNYIIFLDIGTHNQIY